MHILAAYVSIFGGVFALIMAGAQLFVIRSDRRNKILAALWFCVAYWLGAAGAWELLPDNILYRNILYITGDLCYALTGPLFYLYFFRSIFGDGALTSLDKWLFLPPCLAFIGYLTPLLIEHELINSADYEYLPVLIVSAYIASGSMILPLMLTSIKVFKLSRNLKNSARTFSKAVLLITCPGLCLAIIEVPAKINLGGIAAILVVLIFWIGNRYPHLLQLIRQEAKRERYEKSRLAALDNSVLLNRLDELMENERLYLQEDLKLNDLARRLGIKEYQLSELINTRLNKNFALFLNEYRVREAKRLLKENPEQNILSIGLRVGFNSNSAFYNAFRSLEGLSPGEFRKRKP